MQTHDAKLNEVVLKEGLTVGEMHLADRLNTMKRYDQQIKHFQNSIDDPGIDKKSWKRLVKANVIYEIPLERAIEGATKHEIISWLEDANISVKNSWSKHQAIENVLQKPSVIEKIQMDSLFKPKFEITPYGHEIWNKYPFLTYYSSAEQIVSDFSIYQGWLKNPETPLEEIEIELIHKQMKQDEYSILPGADGLALIYKNLGNKEEELLYRSFSFVLSSLRQILRQIEYETLSIIQKQEVRNDPSENDAEYQAAQQLDISDVSEVMRNGRYDPEFDGYYVMSLGQELGYNAKQIFDNAWVTILEYGNPVSFALYTYNNDLDNIDLDNIKESLWSILKKYMVAGYSRLDVE